MGVRIAVTFGDGSIDRTDSDFSLDAAKAEWQISLPDYNVLRGERMLTGEPYIAFLHPLLDEREWDLPSNTIKRVVIERASATEEVQS